MIILAIECATSAGSVAVCDNDKLIAQAYTNIANTHSETLLPMAVSVIKNAGISLDEVDMFACGVGPGSFTGLRICVSTVKGLAFGKNKPCVGVSVLDSLACSLKAMNGIIVPVLDARRCGLYNSIYLNSDGEINKLTPDSLTLEKELGEQVTALAKEKKTNVYITGDAVKRLEPHVKTARLKKLPEGMLMPTAYHTALAALDKYNSTKDKSSFTDLALSAVYLRATQAERERLERIEKSK